jgi:DNA-binding CsgD family transcriptional regulator
MSPSERIHDEHVAEGLPTPRPQRFPWQLLGMGFFIAWLYCSCFRHILFPEVEANGPITLDFWVAGIACILCLAFYALMARRYTPLLERRGLLWTTAVLAVLGTALSSFADLSTGAQEILLVVGSAGFGAGQALLFLLWNETYSTLPVKTVTLCYAASYLIGGVVYLLCWLPDPLVSTLIECLLPAVSVVMLSYHQNTVSVAHEEEDGAAEEDDIAWRFPFRPVILMVLYSFTYNLFLHLTGGTTAIDGIGTLLVAVPTLLLTLFMFKRFDIRMLYKLALPFMVLALIVEWLIGDMSIGHTVAGICANTGSTAFRVFALVVLCNICFRYRIRAIWLFGITQAACLCAELAASLTGEWVVDTYGLGTLPADTALGAAVVLLVAASMLLLSDKDFSGTWAISPRAFSLPEREAKALSVMNFYEEFAWKCARVARSYGLTHREEEVLALLAQRKSIAAIESDLFIANGTAKTHVRHIYAKLGVHNREEVALVVEQAR